MQLTTILKCSTLRFADIINLAGDLTTITVHGADGHTHTVSITILRAIWRTVGYLYLLITFKINIISLVENTHVPRY